MSLFASILRSLGDNQGIPAPLRPPRPCTSSPWDSAAPHAFITRAAPPTWDLPTPAAMPWVPGLRFSDTALAAFGRQGTTQRPWWRAAPRVAAGDAPAPPPPRVASSPSPSPAVAPPLRDTLSPLPARANPPARPFAAPAPPTPHAPAATATQTPWPGAAAPPSLGEPAEPGPEPTGSSDPPEGGTGPWGPWAGSAEAGATPAEGVAALPAAGSAPVAPPAPATPTIFPAPAPHRPTPSLGEPAEPGPEPSAPSATPAGGPARPGPWAGPAAPGATPAEGVAALPAAGSAPVPTLAPYSPAVLAAPHGAPAGPGGPRPATTVRHEVAPSEPTAGSGHTDGTDTLRGAWLRLTRRVVTVLSAGRRRHRGLLLAVRRDFVTLAVSGPRAPRLLFLPIRHILAVIEG